MFAILERAIIGMALLRLLSGTIEIFAAYLMIRFNEVEKALIINSSLAIVGPLILIFTTAIGLYGIAGKVSFGKFIWIVIGVGCIIYGIKSR
ncbi:YqhV family protein [Virgibacillus soli]|uniref:YqhV family protein n=1 Tax=Paracerasibacillus soli TaxID=480284 RepID=A0ABU5CRE0_9BACI|nr:YqhV family protein [Virgibacillus soli]MDY0408008.1 YqhV family protein [Virgibacillus soli]